MRTVDTPYWEPLQRNAAPLLHLTFVEHFTPWMVMLTSQIVTCLMTIHCSMPPWEGHFPLGRFLATHSQVLPCSMHQFGFAGPIPQCSKVSPIALRRPRVIVKNSSNICLSLFLHVT